MAIEHFAGMVLSEILILGEDQFEVIYFDKMKFKFSLLFDYLDKILLDLKFVLQKRIIELLYFYLFFHLILIVH